MPAPGAQHNSIANPFEEVKPRMSEYTAQEIATLQGRLEKQLGPEFLSSRTGPSGQKVHYIAAEKCITLANEVFGFNGWSSAIQNIQIDFVDENPQTQRVSLGLSVIVRVTLRDGTFHEDIGYGHIENCKGKAAAFEKAKKEGTTDAMKRALRTFGNVLGNCIYDKVYLQKVTKMKSEPVKFNEKSLHRHPDFAIKEIKQEKVESSGWNSGSTSGPDSGAVSIAAALGDDSFEDLLGEFDEADFCVAEEGHPDEVGVPESVHNNAAANGQQRNTSTTAISHMQPPSRPLSRSTSAAGNYARAPQTPNQAQSRPAAPQQNQQSHSNHSRPNPPQQKPGNNAPRPNANGPGQQSNAQAPVTQNQNQAPANGSEPVAFFSARAVAKTVDETGGAPPPPQPSNLFNPKAESPSIRKTPGIDHSTSKPVGRNGQHVAPSQPAAAESPAGPVAVANAAGRPSGGPQAGGPGMGMGMGRTNFVNPQMDQAKRVGAPRGPGSPLANRGQYKPPMMMKRPLAGDGTASRPPLADVSTNAPAAGGAPAAAAAAAAGVKNGGGPGVAVSGDAKRQKIG